MEQKQKNKRPKHPSMPSSFRALDVNKQFNVDYFSHPWDELDLKASWSMITKHKKTYIDGVRLENASWRKWMQQRLNLGKVAPDSLRWKKEEDITWLYGPLIHNLSDPSENEIDLTSHVHPPLKIYTSRSSSISTCSKKSALKNHSVVSDLKKFRTKTDQIFARSGLSANKAQLRDMSPKRRRFSQKKLNYSLSDSELLRDPTKYLNVHEKSLLDRMDSEQFAMFSPNSPSPNMSPTSPLESFTSRDTKSSSRLRFSNEVEVLEFGDCILERFKQLSIGSEPQSPSKEISDVASIASNDSSTIQPILIASTSTVNEHPVHLSIDEEKSKQKGSVNNDNVVLVDEDGSSWVGSVINYASDLVAKYYNGTE